MATAITFPASQDGHYAWSAAFIDYVMRIAGAGDRFPYSADHADYINVAKIMALGRTSGWLITAERPQRLCTAAGRSDLRRTGQVGRTDLR